LYIFNNFLDDRYEKDIIDYLQKSENVRNRYDFTDLKKIINPLFLKKFTSMLDILNYNPFSKYESVFNTLNSKPKSIRRKLHELTNKYSKISFDLKIYDKYGNIPLLGTLMKLIKYLKMNDKNLIILPSVFIYII